MKPYLVSYSLPYTHDVVVGIHAQDPAVAMDKAQAAFDAGTIWDDTNDMPLLYDDFNEMEDGTLIFKVEVAKNGVFQVDASVFALRRQADAVAACKALLASYPRLKVSGRSDRLNEFFKAVELARRVVKYDYG